MSWRSRWNSSWYQRRSLCCAGLFRPESRERVKMMVRSSMVAVGIAVGLCMSPGVEAQSPAFSDAQSLFFNARYAAASDLALDLRSAEPDDLAIWELRTSGLLF